MSTKLKNYRLTESGKTQVQAYLQKYHVQFELLTKQNFVAWHAEVVEHLNDGQGAYIEIPANVSNTGRPEVCTISADGYESYLVQDD